MNKLSRSDRNKIRNCIAQSEALLSDTNKLKREMVQDDSVEVANRSNQFYTLLQQEQYSFIDKTFLKNPFYDIVGPIPGAKEHRSEFDYYRVFCLEVTVDKDMPLQDKLTKLINELADFSMYVPVGFLLGGLCAEVHSAPINRTVMCSYLAYDLYTYDDIRNAVCVKAKKERRNKK